MTIPRWVSGKKAFNLPAQPVGVDHQAAKAPRNERFQRPQQQGLAAHHQQRLGRGIGQGPHALATAGGQDHRGGHVERRRGWRGIGGLSAAKKKATRRVALAGTRPVGRGLGLIAG
jgi:hypothetical protein